MAAKRRRQLSPRLPDESAAALRPVFDGRHHARRAHPHEWLQHGTCSGLSGDAYFALTRKTFQALNIPARLQAPSSSFSLAPKELKQAFEQANPNLNAPILRFNCAATTSAPLNFA